MFSNKHYILEDLVNNLSIAEKQNLAADFLGYSKIISY